MAARPAKRQRRSTVVLSDEDEGVSDSLPLRTPKSNRQLELDQGNDATLSLSPNRTRSQALRKASKKSTSKASTSPSPKKSRKTSKIKEPEKSKSLHSFFGRAAEDQRWQRKSITPDDGISDGEYGDAIEDDDLSDAALQGLDDSSNTRSVLDRRKASLTATTNGTQKANGSLPPSTQRFVKPALPPRQSVSGSNVDSPVDQEQHRPWADRYGPVNLDELAVHKKKAADVQKWLDNVLAGRDRQRLLILKGSAGSGKTTTISLLSKAMGFGMAFWQNPTHYDPSSNGSVATQFDDFLNRGGHFGTLAFGEPEPIQVSTPTPSDRRVLVVEEFPAGMARSSDSFRSVIQQFLARSAPAAAAPFRQQQIVPLTPPVVMIISETLLSSSTAFSDSFTAHRLLGPEILNHPMTTVIEFNPVAPTFISKALDLVIKKEAKDSKRRRVPGPALLSKLAEMGDVRNAISSLEFLSLRNDNDADWSGTLAPKPKKSSKTGVPLTDMEESSLKLISQRETTLDMFHAAGKVVYNKRQDPRVDGSNAELPPRPPEHLMHTYSPKISEVDIEALLNETGTDIQTFVSTLHENHVLSCNGNSFADCFEKCSDILSASDVLNPDSRSSLRSRTGINASIVQSHLQGSSFDALRQDEISFNVATRGLIFNLPYPVKRTAPSSGRKADSFKMFYPTSLRLWKPAEEIEALISLFTYDEILDPGKFVKIKTEPGTESVANWKVRDSLAPTPDTKEDGVNDDDEPTRKATPSREVLTLDILPYLTKIKHARKEDTKNLSKITHLTGASVQMTGDEPDEDEPGDESIVAARKLNTGSRFAPGSKPAVNNFGSPLKGIKKESTTEVEMEKLFLEDDDIEDD